MSIFLVSRFRKGLNGIRAVLLKANDQFLGYWGAGRTDEAVKFFSEKTTECVRFYFEGNKLKSDEEARADLLQALDEVGRRLAEAENIEDIVRAAEIVHPDIAVVLHPDERDFTIGSIPDHLAEDYSCSSLVNDIDFSEPETFVYGNYFATVTRLDLVGEDPAVLYLIWSREGGEWKITAFHVLGP